MSWDIVEKALNLLGGLSGIALLILGVAKLLEKNFLDHWFAKDIERYKSEFSEIKILESVRRQKNTIYQRFL